MSVWINDFIKINRYSRPGTKLKSVAKIILHYTANHGASANNHVIYFGKTMIEQNEKLPEQKRRFASAHIFTDKNEARCIIPLDEVAFAANDGTFRGVPELKPNANHLSISVEMCQEKDGSFHPDMISRTVNVMVELCKKYKLDPLTDIVRHYDVTKKNCPAPWVKNGQAFIDFKNTVASNMGGKLMWGKTEFKKGQIGKVTILQPINLWTDGEEGNLEFTGRVLQKDEEFRVYNYRENNGGQYGVGGGLWVTKMPSHIKYETPSKALLAKAEEFYK